MTVVTPPLFLNVDSEYTAADLGLPYRDLIAEGVVGSSDMAVSERGAGANMSVDVAAGVAWVQGDESATQPTYRCYNDATVNLAIAAADGTDPRIDRVIAEVRDAVFAGVSTDWRLRVITGTPTAGATLTNLSGAAAVPNNALLLANVSIPATDTTIADAQIGDVRPRAKAGLLPKFLSATNAGTSMSSSSTSYTDMSTVGPSITITETGSWRLEWGFQGTHAAATGVVYCAYKINSATTNDSDGVRGQAAANGSDVLARNGSKVVALTAGDVVKLQWRTAGGGAFTIATDGTIQPWITATLVG